MMWCALTISGDLTNIIPFPMEIRQAEYGHWEKGPELELFKVLRKNCLILRSLRRIWAF